MSRRYHPEGSRELATLESQLAEFDAEKAKQLFFIRLQIFLILLGILTFLYYKHI